MHNDVKKLNESYIYQKYPEYAKKIIECIMEGHMIETSDKSFRDIIFDLSRQRTSDSIMRFIKSDYLCLMISKKKMPKYLKVFAAKDIKNKSNIATTKIFIDCTDVITFSNGIYICNDIGKLLSYIIAGNIFYNYNITGTIQNKVGLCRSLASAYSSLFCNVLRQIYKINLMGDTGYKCTYFTTMFFYENLLHKGGADVLKEAKQRSQLSDTAIGLLRINTPGDMYDDINTFVNGLGEVLHLKDINTELIVEKWIFYYGPSTLFALEMFPNLCQLFTDAYIGAYLNNQKTIEKLCVKDISNISTILLSLDGGDY